MKVKIVVKISTSRSDYKQKAMKIAACTEGVTSIAIEGRDKDELVVIGEVDPICLSIDLRKRLCSADIISVTEVVAPRNENPIPIPIPIPNPDLNPNLLIGPNPVHRQVVYDANTTCCTM